jgi:hypothetical protein
MQITCLNCKDFSGNSRNCKGISAPKTSIQRYLDVSLVKKGKIDIVISRFCCKILEKAAGVGVKLRTSRPGNGNDV